MPLKQSACFHNKFFRHFIPFLLNSSLKQTNIWIGSCICSVLPKYSPHPHPPKKEEKKMKEKKSKRAV